MDILRYVGVPEGASLVDDRNPQGKTPGELQAILESEEADKANYQQYLNDFGKENGVTLFKHAQSTWREESLLKAGYDKLVDLSQEYDGSYDPSTETPPEGWPKQYQDALLDAMNPGHYQRLKTRYQDQIDYNVEGELLGGAGTAVSLAAMIVHPETALLGAGEAAALTKLALKSGAQRFVAGAAIGGLSNVGQELAIIANNKSRDKLGAVIAGATGAAFGGALSAFTKPKGFDEFNKARKIIGEDYSNSVKNDLDVSIDPSRLKDTPVTWTDDTIEEVAESIPRQRAYAGPLKSIGSQGMASENPYERMITWLTVETAQGTGGKQVASQSAALNQDLYLKQLRSDFHIPRLKAIKQWQRETGRKSSPWDDSLPEAFDREVVSELAYRKYPESRPTGVQVSPAIKTTADAYEATEIKRFGMLQGNGVRGYDDIKADSKHVSQRWDTQKMISLERTHGRDFIMQLLKRGILASNEFANKAKYGKLGDKLTDEFMDTRAGFMAKAIYERFITRADTVNLAKSAYMRVKDRTVLEKRLQDAIDDPLTIEHILKSTDGKDSRVLNEYMNQIGMNLNVEADGVKVLDLLNTDLGRTMDSSFRRSAGKAAMAKKGFADEADYMEVVAQAGEWSRAKTKRTAKEIEKDSDRLQKLWGVVMGDNLEGNPNSGINRFLRGIRRAATLTSMNQVGFAQASELGRVAGSLGVRMFLKQIPALASMRRQMLNGKFKDDILNDIEAAIDVRIGDDHLLHHPLLRGDSGGYSLATESSNAILKGADMLSMKGMHVQGYINGMNKIMQIQQRMHARGFFMRLHEDVMKGSRIRRYADLGLSESDLKRIRREFETKSTTTAGWLGKERLQDLRLASFEPALLEKLSLAFHKAQSSAIQRSIGGETAWFMESGFAKMLTQFRNFPMVALEKQLIHDVKFMDQETFTTFIASFGFATMGYMAKSYVNSFGLDKRKRKQYLKNRIGTPAKIAAGASRYMGQLSLLPDVAELAIPYGPHNPFQWSERKGNTLKQYTDGLSIENLGPGPSLINKAVKFTYGLGAAALTGEELTDNTLRNGRGLILYGNTIGLTNAFNYLGRD